MGVKITPVAWLWPRGPSLNQGFRYSLTALHTPQRHGFVMIWIPTPVVCGCL